MNDDAERRLEERLHDLAGGLMPPVVPPSDDVRRGRRRLRRVRAAMAGATGAAVVAVVGLAGLTAGDPTATEIAPASQLPATSQTSAPTPSASAEPEGAGPASPSGSGEAAAGEQRGPAATGSAADGTGGGDVRGTDQGRGGSDQSHHQTSGQTSAQPGSDAPDAPASQDPASPQSTGPSASGPTTSPTPTSSSTGLPTAPTTDPTSPTTGPTAPTTGPTTAPTGPTSGPTAPPSGQPSGPVVPVPPPSDGTVRVHATLRYWNEVLATHLDPTRDHLAAYSRKTGVRQTTVRDGKLFALGSTYAWTLPGPSAKAPGTTVPLQVRVATGWDQVPWSCGSIPSAWSCTPGDPDSSDDPGDTDTLRSEVAVHDGVRQVAVEHADGQVVVLTATPSTARTGGIDADVDDLLAAAADVRLSLPGDAPVAPPTIDPSAFEDAGETALVDATAGEQWLRTRADRAPRVSGQRSVDGTVRGTLAWWATPTYSGGGWTCLTSYRTCTDVQVGSGADAEVVHVASVRSRAGGGWVVVHEGPSYVVSVYSADRTLARKRAIAFVTDPAWQPTR
ncbi:hypothetical protein [Nocardioides flavescens]|uniref:hypothetical protein n=1 Tax=Nocardioides flavescens TaxID=2691959 RepID=UPI00192756B1|nr:hypothetical protein [Nocardioides flavescens]